MSSLRMMLYVGAGLLVLAIAPWPFDEYYTMLRFYICATCAFGAYVSLRENHAWMAVSFLAAGVFFNPIVKVQITREIWIVADLLVAGLFLAVARLAPYYDALRPTGQPIEAETAPAEVSP